MRLLIPMIALWLCVPGVTRAQTVCPTPWPLEEVLRIGSAETTDLVAGVRDLAIGPDSALYVAQAQVPAVNVFSLDGQLLRQIGRAGRGPGDIEWSAFGLGWIGDTLWVADLNRIQLFTTDERVPDAVIQFYLSIPEEGTQLTPGRMLADGTFVGARQLSDMRAWSSRGDDPGLALRRISRSGEILDTIAIIDWPDNAVANERNPAGWPRVHPLREAALPGLQEYLTALKPDGSAVVQIGQVHEDATPPTFDLLVVSIRGDTLLHRAIDYEPREVTRAMERRLADEYAGWAVGDYTSRRMQLLETTLERQRSAYRRVFWVPENHPPVRKVVAGTDGTIWLLRELREDRVDVWEIYDSEGMLEGSIEIGQGRASTKPWYPRLAILVASRDEVWGATRGELDQPYLHRYRVDRTCAL
ncbi:MAG: hypothetical protein OXE73_10695 [Gammaproteobacteria bacterium]|nr:hypothetical protein [Gammaproteobacteria bacterium]